jgi:molybdopterin-biosynthesis enzyme MoeA-like protein
LQLGWAHYLGDTPQQITRFLKRSLATDDIVFSCGGIGATPDDHTRQCAADALGVPLKMHPFAEARIRERIEKMARDAGKPIDWHAVENQKRLAMGEFPEGATAIPNAFNGIPGFSVGTHYFVPGFPEMAWDMIAWALDTYHAPLFHQLNHIEKSIFIVDAMEATLTPLMEAIEVAFPQVKTFSLPRVGSQTRRPFVELGVKGDATQAEAAFESLLLWMAQHQMPYQFDIPDKIG